MLDLTTPNRMYFGDCPEVMARIFSGCRGGGYDA